MLNAIPRLSKQDQGWLLKGPTRLRPRLPKSWSCSCQLSLGIGFVDLVEVSLGLFYSCCKT